MNCHGIYAVEPIPKTTSEAACRRQRSSFVPAKTPLGQLLGQISDVLSITYAICPKISQKKEQTAFCVTDSGETTSFLLSPKVRTARVTGGQRCRSPHVSKGVTLNATSPRIATALMPWNRAPKPTSEAARRQWLRIATSFTAWVPTANESSEAAWPPTCLCRVRRTLQGHLGMISAAFARFCFAAFAFSLLSSREGRKSERRRA